MRYEGKLFGVINDELRPIVYVGAQIPYVHSRPAKRASYKCERLTQDGASFILGFNHPCYMPCKENFIQALGDALKEKGT